MVMNIAGLKQLFSLMICISMLSPCLADSGDGTIKTVNDKVKSSNDGNIALWPSMRSNAVDSTLEKRISKFLLSMTLEQKIGQMIQIEIQSFTPETMKKYRFGSVLNGGGSWPQKNKHAVISDWVTLADSVWTSCTAGLQYPIPPLWGTDAVHGLNNVGTATLFPHNIGLGAAHDTNLVYRIAQVTAKEVSAAGIDWNFAPTLAVVRDDRWGRTYESFSEDPAIVKDYAGKIISGLQGKFGAENVLATAKHFIGDGGTDDGIDRGDCLVTEKDLVKIHAAGYISALKSGAQVIMASYSSWKGNRMHDHKYLLTDVLKKQMGFDGFVISDYNAIELIDGCTKQNCPQSVLAGIDMFMIPDREDWEAFYNNLKSQVETGSVPMSRIDDAVSRILRVKLRMGLFEKPKPSERALSGKSELIGASAHREVAREAVRKSLVLLKNNHKILPLDRKLKVLVAGIGADSIPMQLGGWALTWQGGSENCNLDFKGSTSILDGIKAVAQNVKYDPTGKSADKNKYDVAIVVIGEEPYAEYRGDIKGGLTLEHALKRPQDLIVLQTIKNAGVPVVTVFLSGRPLYVNKELNSSDAFVAAWLPGSEGEGVTDVLFKSDSGAVNFDFTGKLSFSWPKSPCQTTVNVNDKIYDPMFPIGYGLTYTSKNQDLKKLPESDWEGYGCTEVKMDSLKTENVLTIFNGQFDSTQTPWMGGPSNWGGKPGYPDSSMPDISVQAVSDNLNNKGKALQLTFKGPAYWGVGEKERDLSGYFVGNYLLVFDILVKCKPAGRVYTLVLCHYPCSDQVDITDRLNVMPLETWTQVRIPLKNFLGTNFLKVDSRFQIQTTGAAEFRLANIRWEKDPQGQGNAP
jgi:beta-glucosidase